MPRFFILKYFVMCLHEYKLIFFKEKCQEKWENAYFTVKSATASGALSGPQTPSL